MSSRSFSRWRFSISSRSSLTCAAACIIPFILLLVFVGSYTANGQIADLIVTLIFGVLSYFMVLFGWPRPPFVLGFVLGKVIETYLFISMTRYGFSWLTHPIVIVLMILMVVVIAYPYIQQRRQRWREPLMRKANFVFCIFLIAIAAYAIFAATGWSFKTKLFPLGRRHSSANFAGDSAAIELFGGKEQTNESAAMDVDFSIEVPARNGAPARVWDLRLDRWLYCARLSARFSVNRTTVYFSLFKISK